MNEFSSRKFLKEISLYFEKKISPETGDLWYQEIKNIPEESLNYIAIQIKKKESFPRNFPATAWALYYQWLKDNPQKLARNDCPDCGGTGWIEENHMAYKCGSCNPEPLFVNLDITGFSGQVKVLTKRKQIKSEWQDQF